MNGFATQTTKENQILAIFRLTVEFLKETPALWVLFFVISLFDFAALTLLFFAPSEPYSTFFAPIIRTFWGERFLHYPENFLLLPKLLSHAHTLIVSIFGVFVSGLVIKKAEIYVASQSATTTELLAPVFRKYFLLILGWAFFYFVYTLGIKQILPLLPRGNFIRFGFSFAFGLFLQGLFAFMMPAIVVSKKGVLASIAQSFKLALSHYGVILALLLLPMAFLFAFSFLKALGFYYNRFYPEMMLWVLSLGIIFSMVVDLVVTTSTAILYFKIRRNSN